MVNTCFLCKWRADKEPQRTFHKFPKDESERKKWLAIFGMPNITIGARAILCSSHFEADCFRYGLVRGRKFLKEGSVPSFNLQMNAVISPSQDSSPSTSPLPFSDGHKSLSIPLSSTSDFNKASCSLSPSVLEERLEEERPLKRSNQELEDVIPYKKICYNPSSDVAECPSNDLLRRVMHLEEARMQDRQKLLSLQCCVRRLQQRDTARKSRLKYLENKNKERVTQKR